jgi:hypothetical protein
MRQRDARGLVKSMVGRLPKCSTESFCERVSANVPAELEDALRPLMMAIQTLNEQIRCCDVQIEKLATEIYPQTALPRQVSGVGALTAICKEPRHRSLFGIGPPPR